MAIGLAAVPACQGFAAELRIWTLDALQELCTVRAWCWCGIALLPLLDKPS